MIIWSSPHIRYWYTAQDMRRSSPAGRVRVMAAVLELGSRSDRIGRRARELLASIRFGPEVDSGESRPEHIHIYREVTAARWPMPGDERRPRLFAESERRIAQGKACIAR